MPRKSLVTILHERHGGKWTFDRETNDRWHSDDGRTVIRKVDCRCWAIPGFDGDTPCRCRVNYILKDQDGEKVINLSDPRRYRKNGRSTYRLEKND